MSDVIEEAGSQPIAPGEEVVPQSAILDEGEVKQTLAGDDTPTEEPQLPSEEPSEELIGGKFKSQEDLLNAYKELESKLGKPAEEPNEPPQEPKEEPPADSVKLNGVDVQPDDFNKYYEEYGKDKTLSEDTYKEIQEKYKLSKEQIDEQIEFVQYKEQKAMDKILEPFGTMDDFVKAGEWARQNWSEEQVTNFNEQLSKSDVKGAQALLTGLFAAYNGKPSTPQDLTLHTNTQPKVEQPKGYATKSEFFKDTNDSRYGKDAGYTKAVEAKMALTDMSKWYEGVSKGL